MEITIHGKLGEKGVLSQLGLASEFLVSETRGSFSSSRIEALCLTSNL
jgi:hypothetical protein